MKSILLFILIFITAPVFSQDKLSDLFPLKKDKVCFEETVAVNNVSRKQLRSRAKDWIKANALTYQDDLFNIDNDSILSSRYLWLKRRVGGIDRNITFHIRVSLSDNSYSYEFTNFRIEFEIEGHQNAYGGGATMGSSANQPFELWAVENQRRNLSTLGKIKPDILAYIAKFKSDMLIPNE